MPNWPHRVWYGLPALVKDKAGLSALPTAASFSLPQQAWGCTTGEQPVLAVRLQLLGEQPVLVVPPSGIHPPCMPWDVLQGNSQHWLFPTQDTVSPAGLTPFGGTASAGCSSPQVHRLLPPTPRTASASCSPLGMHGPVLQTHEEQPTQAVPLQTSSGVHSGKDSLGNSQRWLF